MSGNEADSDRRSVLKAIGAGAVTGLGATGVVGARSSELPRELKAVKQNYHTSTAAEAAIREYSSNILREFADRGLLDRGDVSELETDLVESAREHAEADEGTHVAAFYHGGVRTAHIVVKKETATHEIELVVQPERDLSYARALPKASGETVRLRDSDGGLVDTSGCDCYTESTCKSDPCDMFTGTVYERECCECDDGTSCDYYSSTGSCCDA